MISKICFPNLGNGKKDENGNRWDTFNLDNGKKILWIVGHTEIFRQFFIAFFLRMPLDTTFLIWEKSFEDKNSEIVKVMGSLRILE